MGLERTTVVAPSARGILDPRTGKPVGADDRFFSGLNDQLSDKGLLVAVSDDLVTWARTASLMRMPFGLACCAVQVLPMPMPGYAGEVVGFHLAGAPRQSAVL